MIPAADLAVMYAAFAVTATVGATSGPVHLRQGDVDALGERITRDYSMRYRLADFPALVRGDAVTIESVAYEVREVRQVDNGVEAIARLTKT